MLGTTQPGSEGGASPRGNRGAGVLLEEREWCGAGGTMCVLTRGSVPSLPGLRLRERPSLGSGWHALVVTSAGSGVIASCGVQLLHSLASYLGVLSRLSEPLFLGGTGRPQG